MAKRKLPAWAALLAALSTLFLACAIQQTANVGRHRWWAGLGPVLPHDTFPADCELCHAGEGWSLTEEFDFDHELETGVALEGAHEQAQCLRCHNDRGPVAVFANKGCVGCHEDFHFGDLGPNCTQCHTEQTWQPFGMIARHDRTRFPLEGAHLTVACQRCHPGARVGNFIPQDPNCLSCHREDMLAANNPNHVGLGWVDNCDRCHYPVSWNQAEINNP